MKFTLPNLLLLSLSINVSHDGILGVYAYSNPLFVQESAAIKKAPSKNKGIEIELPDFDELFNRIETVSPLAKLALQGGDGGFDAMEDKSPAGMKWKTLESKKKRVVHHIDKIDNFQNLHAPLLRFRSTLKGPCIGDAFADFIMNFDERKKWDVQIAAVDELYPVKDLGEVNNMMMGKFGECSRLGIGYCQTKPNFVVDSREQLTMCGIQEFPESGAALIWGTEMEDRHNHLFPPTERHTRARSHIFSTTLVPSGPDSFDVEYVLQLDTGGKIPTFMTTPVVIDSVKSMFNHANNFYSGKGGALVEYLKNQEKAFS